MRTDITRGLSIDEVKKLTEEGQVNVTVKNQSKTVGQIIYGNIFTYFNLIFTIFALLLILVRSYMDMTFLPIILCNTLIGIVQEIRSKRVLDKLNVLNTPKTTVIRDGNESDVPTNSLVKGDLCRFKAGNQIGADAVIAAGSVRVNEALVTGEADEIMKREGDTLLSGSFIVSGECGAELTNVGLDSYAAKLMVEAKASRKKTQTEMMHSLDSLVKIIGIAIIPVGIAMFSQDYFFLHMTAKDSVVAVVAALVGMIPEGLYLLASVALVVSVMRLGQKRVLVHEMSCVETLARVNVLCVDKTGTITENKMSVEKIIPMESYIENEDNAKTLHLTLGDCVLNMPNDNETMITLKEYFTNNTGEKALKVSPFSSEVKYSGVEFSDTTYILGAPEKVLLGDYEKHSELIEEYSVRGCRVLVFGRYGGELDGKPLTQPVNPLGLVVISNPIRAKARETFTYFKDQGVDIKVISGDNPITVSHVAAKAGIDNADKYVDASTLTSQELVDEAVVKYSVFGRVEPQMKRQLVKALKSAGKVVAMTGDGVNDVLALKTADCSVAMASGSEAASNAAQIVLLESDFSCMPEVVLEGRRVVNNIQRSASLFLVKNIFSILMAVFVLFAADLYPLYPTQLSLLGAFTIGTPAFILALQPNKSIITGRFIVNVVVKALPAGLTDFILVAVLSVVGGMREFNHDEISTICIYVLLFVGIMALVRICRPFDWIRLALCICMTLGIFIAVAFAGNIFKLSNIGAEGIRIMLIFMAIAVPLFIALCRLVKLIGNKLRKK